MSVNNTEDVISHSLSLSLSFSLTFSLFLFLSLSFSLALSAVSIFLAAVTVNTSPPLVVVYAWDEEVTVFLRRKGRLV